MLPGASGSAVCLERCGFARCLAGGPRPGYVPAHMVSPQRAAGRPRHCTFVFGETKLSGRRVELNYRLAGGPDPDVAFVETLELPVQVAAPDPADPAVVRLLDGIHRTFGVSYFKAAV